jgi:hypothetical protein
LATYDIEQMAQLLNAVRGGPLFVTVMLAEPVRVEAW